MKNLNKKHRKAITYLSMYAAILLILVSCANIVNPSGGPRDTTAPKPIKSSPANYSLQFNQNKIEITFDEFILLRDLKSQLLISPPLSETPDISVRGKTLVIEIKEKLKENTTYTLFFGKAIIDLTEGNAVSSYEFVFSTGNFIDSMYISGKVSDAFTQKPEKDIYVMLYEHTYDSIPYREKPFYIAKTDENGDYTIHNLRNISYKIFALKDVNNNFKFDQLIEKIAFADELVLPQHKLAILADTSLSDSLQKDSLHPLAKLTVQPVLNNLRAFLETDTKQRILKAEFIKKGQLKIAFRFPVTDLEITFLNKFEDQQLKVEEWNATKDTLNYWIFNPEIDSLHLIIDDNNQLRDTLNLRFKSKITKTAITAVSRLFPVSNLSQTFDFYKRISFTFPNPMSKHDSLAVTLIEANDTIHTYAYATDAVHRKFVIKKELKQGQDYKLIVKQDVLTDIFGFTNDSIVYSFKTNTGEDFGNFIFNVSIKDTVHPYIIQLLSENGDVLQQRIIDKDTKLKFQYLVPGTYSIKAIEDKNRNKKWDTGNYGRKIQPENVINYPTKISIKANWDLEENWKL